MAMVVDGVIHGTLGEAVGTHLADLTHGAMTLGVGGRTVGVLEAHFIQDGILMPTTLTDMAAIMTLGGTTRTMVEITEIPTCTTTITEQV
jgi:hypothetical protein